jgi:chromosome segregation ATPase
MKLRSKLSGLHFDCDEKEKSLKILEQDFIDSRSDVQNLTEERNKAIKLKGTMSSKILELQVLNSQQNEHLATLEAKMEWLKESHEAETDKLRRAAAEAKVNFELEKVKKEDAIAKKDHLNTLVGNFRSLKDDYFCVATRYCEELERTFSSIGARSWEKKIIDGDIVGVMRWIHGKVGAFKGVLSTREDYCVWIGA